MGVGGVFVLESKQLVSLVSEKSVESVLSVV